ncbi:calponin homology domain-containing protein DDB_G0272472 isoform X5 [Drosophila takahashii]|uniref:calponin homology domain-containing protein DDB_G0272472 isoform X5 n=1 Tax=Drosophila takahashii TaxID=29030 RepID=UPI0038995585
MNNFTTTTAAAPPKEALPRSGHVNEVCKEWLVREDGALAYKLQSQEINDFYKGNRYRNAVVREDFPTALHEQIKEKEQAQRRVDAYRRRLTEQEEHDKRVAKEIADKLERDLQEQQQKELQQSELIAKQMQEIYVNLPPVPPPATRDKSRPPPRPAKKLSPEKYDQLVGNFGLGPAPGSVSGSAKAAERHMQQHADDIELYVDPCDYASLREIGLPMEEIQEMSKKLKQEQKDELLARRLQAIESKDCVRQEHRDRLLAIEAQDKELAKMLQDREKAKAKRAKEKARLRKTQQKEAAEAANGNGSLLCGTNSHCGPMLPLPPDCLSTTANHSQADIDVEAYSNPIDVLNNSREQRPHNGPLTNGSLTRDGGSGSNHSSMQRQQRSMAPIRGEDDIYTLPVDSCRPGPRPVSLHMAAEAVQQLQTHNSMTRSEHYGSEAGSHDSSHLSGQDISPHMKYSKSGNFGIYIKMPAPRRLTCQFRVLDDQIQVKIVKKSPRTSARISEP